MAVAVAVRVKVAVAIGVFVDVGVEVAGCGSPSPMTRTVSDAGDPTSYLAKAPFTATRMVLPVGVLSGTLYETA